MGLKGSYNSPASQFTSLSSSPKWVLLVIPLYTSFENIQAVIHKSVLVKMHDFK